MMPDPDPTDAERYPTLSEHGRHMLERLREHPAAPMYRNQSGNRLTAEDVERVRAFEREVLSTPVAFAPGCPPPFALELMNRCFREVPFYRAQGGPPPRFEEVVPVSRADLSRDIARFVPDDIPVDRLINFQTSGTTGHPLLIASHPVVAAGYLAFHKRALWRFGIELRHGRGQVGVVLLGLQRRCFTYVSVTPTMNESGLAKINLHPADWRRPEDRATYLDALDPEIYAGDPISFAALLDLPITKAPRALLSTSMALSAGLRVRLEERFGCPVVDLYSMNEAGPIAAADPSAGGHVLLQPGTYVEILDPAGRPLPPGTRGEITLTGGFNFCLPLLRYRTGDHAALSFERGEPVLIGLSGRPPVRFRTMAGAWLNNIEITHALHPFALSQFALHQAADGALVLRVPVDAAGPAALRTALEELFGASQPMAVVPLDLTEGKVVQYTSALPDAEP